MAAAAAGPEDLEKRASDAFVDENFQLSADLYSQALVMDPKNAKLLANRAQANIKLQNYTEAVADANKAIELDPSMWQAYLRKGIACMELEEYHTAKAALALGAALEENNPKFKDLMKDCDERIAEETYDISTKPTCNVPPTIVSPSIGSVEDSKPGNDNFHQPAVVKPKYRHEHYQKPDEVVLSIFAKGIPAENVVVDFGEQILSVTIDIPGEDAYHFQPRLFGKIVPDRCRYQVLSTKIEVRLAKAEAINWASLEYNRENAALQKPNVPSTSVVKARKPLYPSSKTRTDWDKLEAQVKKEEKEEKLDGDAALNKLFREIYQDADEDTRRAMSKSFVESNGTVLSTNWKEVGAKVVEGTPPDGMEMKKWEY